MGIAIWSWGWGVIAWFLSLSTVFLQLYKLYFFNFINRISLLWGGNGNNLSRKLRFEPGWLSSDFWICFFIIPQLNCISRTLWNVFLSVGEKMEIIFRRSWDLKQRELRWGAELRWRAEWFSPGFWEKPSGRGSIDRPTPSFDTQIFICILLYSEYWVNTIDQAWDSCIPLHVVVFNNPPPPNGWYFLLKRVS